MRRSDLAYLAGIMDGEGCIQARASGEGQWVRPSVEVCMTNPIPLRWAKAVSGTGSFYSCPLDPRGKRRRAYKWIISDPKKAAVLLRKMIPFLKVKKGEAVAFCSLASIRAVSKVAGRRAHPKAEALAARVIASLKDNGGEPDMKSCVNAIELAAYLRQAITERDGK